MTKAEDKISVIVPIYKVEEYLPLCVESIKNQTYSNLEIILIDDGSNDGCGEMCDMYAREDPRVVVIHKENGGLSDARNTGIKVATGSFITCVDSDDYISPCMIENLYCSLIESGADISICGDKKTSIRKIPKENEKYSEILEMNKDEAIEQGLYNTRFSLSACGKLYKASLFVGIEYPVGKLYEDLFTTYRLFIRAKKIIFFPQIGYFYFYRINSIVASSYKVAHLDCFEGINQMKKDGVFHNNELIQAYKSAMIEAYAELLEKNPPLFDEPLCDLWNQIKRYRWSVIFNSKSPKRVRAKAALLLFGRILSRKVINKYYKMKWNFNL